MTAVTYLAAGDRLAAYRSAVARASTRLLGMMDREPGSITAGSFDRDHWAWKFRDFPIGMQQMGLWPLVKLHLDPPEGLPELGGDRVRDWIELGLADTLSRQHGNGSFDSVGPFSQDHGMTLAAVHFLASIGLSMEDALPADLLARIRRSIADACRFGDSSEEDYAFISNHQSLFALAYARAARFLDDPALERRSDFIVEQVLERQSSDGWFLEYGGPDPGYETLGLGYLAELHAERDVPGLGDALERSVDFLAYMIHPDGGLGGVHGSRHTSLYVPSGIELLAQRLPTAEAIAGRVAAAFPNTPVVTLDSVDAHNLPPLLSGYMTACTALERRLTEGPQAPGAAPPSGSALAPPSDPARTPPRDPEAEAGGGSARSPLPCEVDDTHRYFEASGIYVVTTPTYYAVVAGKKGGVGSIFARSTRRLVFEDAGYVARSGGNRWTSQLLGSSQSSVDADPPMPVFAVQGRFGLIKQVAVTPFNFLVLRVLNLTVFRVRSLGARLRGMIMRRLITDRASGTLRLEREIRFEPNSVSYYDRLTNDGGRAVTGIEMVRSLMAIHMGSAKYFSRNELADTPVPAIEGTARSLGASETREIRFRVNIDADGEAKLLG